MSGITIKTELSLFKIRLEDLVKRIEENFLKIEMKNTLWGVRDLIILHISYVEEMIEELDENFSTLQKERAETLLWPAEKLINLENLLKTVVEHPMNSSVSNQ